MKFTSELVDKLADLLMIGLTDEENKMVLNEFSSIDDNINKINKIDGIEKVEPMYYALDDMKCTLREDVAEESPAISDLLANADNTDMSEISVPKVVGGDINE